MAIKNMDSQVASIKELIKMKEGDLKKLLDRDDLSPEKRRLIQSRYDHLHRETKDKMETVKTKCPEQKSENGDADDGRKEG